MTGGEGGEGGNKMEHEFLKAVITLEIKIHFFHISLDFSVFEIINYNIRIATLKIEQ